MKNKLFSVLVCCLAIVFLLGAVPCSAESTANDTAGVQAFLDGILAYHGAADIQGWINGYLTQNAGISAEWYVFALSQYGDYDFSAYELSLLEYLSENEVHSASSRLKYALCLATVGSTDGYIAQAINDSIGVQGIMSWIYGLHLLNNGYVCEEYTADEVSEILLDLQCADGGWSLTGTSGTEDVTAMTVQALAPHCKKNTAVQDAVTRALTFLSERQQADGDYHTYGEGNPECTAQVLVALSSLGIDCQSDTRFIKNGNTLLNGILKYRCEGGGFSHTLGGDVNGTATVQVFYATVSYLRMKNGASALYVLDHANPSATEPGESVAPDKDEKEPDAQNSGGYKLWACVGIIGMGGAACLILFLMRKRSYKNFVAVLILVAIGIGVVLLTDFQSTEDYYNGQDAVKENVIGSVTLSIRCDTMAGSSDAEHIPTDGVILDAVVFKIAEGDTVYSILTEAARKYGLLVENEGSAKLAYISGINGLYEYDFGDLSGWVYLVNGESPSVGCGEYRLSDGDVIEWHYSLNLGNDIK
ncbi:MAG: DUF4430 domain-containing protein [Clostridia bacterium]|nr:DUF4430 domain-containing protein [Clostridia bacterium]